MKSAIQQLIFDALNSAGITSTSAKRPSDIFVEHPEHVSFGDYSSNIAMQLARELKQNPLQIAEKIASAIAPSKEIKKIEAVKPGFVNFTLTHEWFTKQLSRLIVEHEKNSHPQFDNIGDNKIVILEFSSPNIAKPMSIGHLRATIIGDSLRRIYRSLGYNVIADNHLGDWGTQFGILLYAYKTFGDKEKIAKNPITELYNLYVEFHKLMAENPSLKSRGKEEFVKLEKGDPENRKLWEYFRDMSMKEFKKTYAALGIEDFDSELGESFYEDKMKRDIDELLEKKIATQAEDGSIYVDLEQYNLGRFIVVKSDGATTYGTRDISTFRYREEQFDFVKNLYVVGLEQVHHFQQIFKVVELMGFKKAGLGEHITFGLIQDETGHKMSTRKGSIITAQTTIDRAVEKALETIKEKNPDLTDKEKVAQIIGVGALKYINLFQNRNTSITFNWDKMLSFDGNTGPYLQYTHARIHGILRKVEEWPAKADLSLLSNEHETHILKQLYKLPEAVELAALENAPNYIADYAFTLASLFNDFYSNAPVLKAEPDVRDARLHLLKAVAVTIQESLYLLGIDAPERM